jgi:hypothetical protein
MKEKGDLPSDSGCYIGMEDKEEVPFFLENALK